MSARSVEPGFPNLAAEVVRGYLDAPERMIAEVIDGELILIPEHLWRLDRGAADEASARRALIGGSFSGPILSLRCAVQGAVVGARVRVPGRDDVQTPGVHFDIPRGPRSPLLLTIGYGLRFDQRFARSEQVQ